MHGQSQRPAARLAGRPPRSSVAPIDAIQEQSVLTEKTKPRQEELAGKDKAPARGACREGQPSHFQETCRDAPRVPASPDERQAFERDKTTTAARRLPRRSHHSVPTLQHIRRRAAVGPFQEHVLGSCAAKRCEVASGDDEKAIVASGGAPNGRFSALLGDADGH